MVCELGRPRRAWSCPFCPSGCHATHPPVLSKQLTVEGVGRRLVTIRIGIDCGDSARWLASTCSRRITYSYEATTLRSERTEAAQPGNTT